MTNILNQSLIPIDHYDNFKDCLRELMDEAPIKTSTILQGVKTTSKVFVSAIYIISASKGVIDAKVQSLGTFFQIAYSSNIVSLINYYYVISFDYINEEFSPQSENERKLHFQRRSDYQTIKNIARLAMQWIPSILLTIPIYLNIRSFDEELALVQIYPMLIEPLRSIQMSQAEFSRWSNYNSPADQRLYKIKSVFTKMIKHQHANFLKSKKLDQIAFVKKMIDVKKEQNEEILFEKYFASMTAIQNDNSCQNGVSRFICNSTNSVRAITFIMSGFMNLLLSLRARYYLPALENPALANVWFTTAIASTQTLNYLLPLTILLGCIEPKHYSTDQLAGKTKPLLKCFAFIVSAMSVAYEIATKSVEEQAFINFHGNPVGNDFKIFILVIYGMTLLPTFLSCAWNSIERESEKSFLAEGTKEERAIVLQSIEFKRLISLVEKIPLEKFQSILLKLPQSTRDKLFDESGFSLAEIQNSG